MKNSKLSTFKIAMTSKQAAIYMRSLCGENGTDVLEHLIQVIGTNREELLGHMFQTLDPAFESQFPSVGEVVVIKNSGYRTKDGKRPFSQLRIIEVNSLSLTRAVYVEYRAVLADGNVDTNTHNSDYMTLEKWNEYVTAGFSLLDEVTSWVKKNTSDVDESPMV